MSDQTLPQRSMFTTPTEEPIKLLSSWLQEARNFGVREPGAMALATADRQGRASTRTVRVISCDNEGLVFASHTGSRKGQELEENPWSSGLLYWRETGQQVAVAGPTLPLPADRSDALWAARPASALPMSVASQQSAPLHDERLLRARVEELTHRELLPRPSTWIGYLLSPVSVEFWQSSPDRFYKRIRYEKHGADWTHQQLQP